MGNIPKSGELYRHFKGDLYQIIVIATHSETEESLVIYQALYGDFSVYARPLSMFLSLVDLKKYPDVKQTYRFELVKREEIKMEQKQVGQEQLKEESDTREEHFENDKVSKELLLFLDAKTSKEKIEILQVMKKDITDRLLDDIAISLDLILEENSLEDKMDRILNFLRTRAKFERR